MDYLSKLDALTHEYLASRDIDEIQHLAIEVDYAVHFFIMDSRRLVGYISPSEDFELAILLSFSNRPKKGQQLERRIAQTQCLNDFATLKDAKTSVYIKKTNNNKAQIVGTVRRVIDNLFPESAITVELHRIAGWHTLEERL